MNKNKIAFEQPKKPNKSKLTHLVPLVNQKPTFLSNMQQKIFDNENQNKNVFAKNNKLTTSEYFENKKIHVKDFENDFNPFTSNIVQMNSVDLMTKKSALKNSTRFRRSSSVDAGNGEMKKSFVKFEEEPKVYYVENWKNDNLTSSRRLMKAYSNESGCLLF